MRHHVTGTAVVAGLLAFIGVGHSAHAKSEADPHWQASSVRLHIDESMKLVHAEAYEVAIAAVTAWQRGAPDLPTLVVEQTTGGQIGYRKGRSNQNVLRYAEGGSSLAGKALGVTIVTSDANTGQIVDADIVLNGAYRFAVMDDRQGRGKVYDLQNVLTHELGHFLGLPEEYRDEDATMFATSRPGETLKRDLNPTDRQAIGELYEPLPEAKGEAEAVGCGGAQIARGQGFGSWPLTLAALAWMTLLRRGRSATGRARAVWALALFAALLTWGESPTERSADFTVVDVSAQWDGGVIWSEVSLQPNGCPTCTPSTHRLPGGELDGLRQQVGALRPAEAGQQLTLRVRGGVFDVPLH